MKILIVTHYFFPHIGGIEVAAYNQAKELVKKGHEVVVVTSKIENEKSGYSPDGIKIVRIKAINILENFMGVPYPLFYPKLLLALKNEIKNCNIVHANGALYMGTFFSSLLTKFYKKPLIITEHVGFVKYKSIFLNLLQKSAFLTIGKIALKLSAKVIVLNSQVGEFIRNEGINTVRYLPNGVDASLFKPVNSDRKAELRKKIGLPDNKKLVLFVGRFVEKKGFDKMFEARNPDYLIIFVGSGNVPEYMRRSKDVIFFNPMPQNELSEIYQASDIFVLPSTGEGFPLSIQEAMACGLPVITSSHEGYSDYLDKNYVKMVEPKPENLRKAIKEVSENEALYREMAEYSRKKAVSDFSWGKNTEGLLKIYHEVLEEKLNER